MRSDLISPAAPLQRPAAARSWRGGTRRSGRRQRLPRSWRISSAAPSPVRFEFWDGTSLGPATGDRGAGALTRCRAATALGTPGSSGLARAFVVGDLAFEGDIFEILDALHRASPERIHVGSRLPWQALQAARRLGVIGRPPPAATGGGCPAGRLASRSRDAQAVQHHYDVSDDFFACFSTQG